MARASVQALGDRARERFRGRLDGDDEAVGQDSSRVPESSPTENRIDRARRYDRRTRLYAWATALVLALIAIVVLIAENTRRVKVGWIFGYSQISLVFLILFAAVLGWLLGMATSVVFRRRTRRS